jgi:hypothetical protein
LSIAELRAAPLLERVSIFADYMERDAAFSFVLICSVSRVASNSCD